LVVAVAGAIAAAPRKCDDRLMTMTDNSQLSRNAQHEILEALDALASQPSLISPVDYTLIKARVDGIAEKEAKMPARVSDLKGKLW